MVQAEVHATMEPSEPKVPSDAQKIDEPMDQVKHPPTQEDPVEQETKVPEELIAGTFSNPTPKINGSRTTITSGSTYAQTYAIA